MAVCAVPAGARTAGSAALRSWVAGFWQSGEPIQTYTLLLRMCSGIQRTFSYQVRASSPA